MLENYFLWVCLSKNLVLIQIQEMKSIFMKSAPTLTEFNETILVFLFLIDFDTSDKNAHKISRVKTLKWKERKNQILKIDLSQIKW